MINVNENNHYVVAILMVHGFIRPRKVRGTQKDLDRLTNTVSNIKSALYQARKGSK